MSATLTPNEEAQLLQTIEMFEVITQSQPLDYQSLEILKEAYFKLCRQTEVVNTSKRIAQAYVQLGQLSSAILEYETVLQRRPDGTEKRLTKDMQRIFEPVCGQKGLKLTTRLGAGVPDTIYADRQRVE